MRSEECCTMDWNLRSFLVSWTHARQLDPPEGQGQLGCDGIENSPEIDGQRPVVSEEHPSPGRNRAPDDSSCVHMVAFAVAPTVSPPARRTIRRSLRTSSCGHLDGRADELSPGGCHDLLRLAPRRSVTMQPMTPAAPIATTASTPAFHTSVRSVAATRHSEKLRRACSRRALTAWARARPGQPEHDQHEHHHRGAGQNARVLRDTHHVTPDDEKRGGQCRHAQATQG